jgi:hypothetical protein
MATAKTRSAPARPRPRDQWEAVAADTDRLPVPGGWIYRTSKRGAGLSTCFVPQAAGRDSEHLAVISRAARELKQKLEQLRKLLDQVSAARKLKGAPMRSTKVH